MGALLLVVNLTITRAYRLIKDISVVSWVFVIERMSNISCEFFVLEIFLIQNGQNENNTLN